MPRSQDLNIIRLRHGGGTPARTVAELGGLHRNSGIRFFHKLREKIARQQQNSSKQFCGKIELDESYFGGIRKEKHGRGRAGKIPVYGDST